MSRLCQEDLWHPAYGVSVSSVSFECPAPSVPSVQCPAPNRRTGARISFHCPAPNRRTGARSSSGLRRCGALDWHQATVKMAALALIRSSAEVREDLPKPTALFWAAPPPPAPWGAAAPQAPRSGVAAASQTTRLILRASTPQTPPPPVVYTIPVLLTKPS